MTVEDRPRSSLSSLGAFDIACVVVGGIIGIGIFFTPSQVARSVDSSTQVVVAWSLGGLIALVGAVVYAQLGRILPRPGGVFAYLDEAFGALPAFLFGWCNWLVIVAGALAVVALIMVQNLVPALGAREEEVGPGLRILLAAGSILGLTILNILGLRLGRWVQNCLTVTKALSVLVIVLVPLVTTAAAVGPRDSLPPVPASGEPKGWLYAMSLAILPVLFSYGGWQHGSFVAGVARRPRRDVPIGILAGVVVVVLLYVTVNLAYLDLLGMEGAAASNTIAVDAIRVALEPTGHGGLASRLLASLIVVSALGVMNTMCMAPPYVLHAMAREGLFPRQVGQLHQRLGTPVLAISLQGGWAAFLLLGAHFLYSEEASKKLDFLLDGVVFMDWLFFGLCGLALLRLLRRAASAQGGRTPLLILTMIPGALFSLLALAVTSGAIWSNAKPSLLGLGVLVLGAGIYWLGRLLGRKAARFRHGG